VGEQLGVAIARSQDEQKPAIASTRQLSSLLASWYRTSHMRALPWLSASTRWQVVSAEMLLDRAVPEHVRHLWPVVAQWKDPEDTVARAEDLLEIGRWIGRKARASQILAVARWLADHPATLDDDSQARRVQGVNDAIADMAILAVPTSDEDTAEEPVLITKGVLRVAARFSGEPVDRRNRMTDGRLAVARLIGEYDDARDAHLALIELANTLCRPIDPLCRECPLGKHCKASQAELLATAELF
jgi:DNA (cytosine-5)-methyltransferase 1